MKVTVKLTWIILVVVVGGLVLCAWKYPRSVVPIGVGIGAATAMAAVIRLDR
jgi:hypothetical protein